LKEHENAIAEVIGHSDLQGTAKGCHKIAEERAKAVKSYLIQKGIAEYRLISRSLSRTQPQWLKESKAIHAQENRRVEVFIYE
jgi:outer membrane protein OmpA-like peptidoglycan-associated protein